MSIDPKEFDASIRPTDDFFHYVNKKWIKKNPIPAEEYGWGSFLILRIEVEKQLKEILENLDKRHELPEGTISQKVRDFYRTGMDLQARDRVGAEPLADFFTLIESIEKKEDVPRIVARMHLVGAWAFWSPFVTQDDKQSDIMALHLYQGGLGMPDRDYYLLDDEKTSDIRKKYRAHIVSMLKLLRWDEAKIERAASAILVIESRLAKAARTKTELRDVHKQYNKKTAPELAALAPFIAWGEYFRGITVPLPNYFIVGQPEFFEEVSRVIGESSIEDMRHYLSWHLLSGMAATLGEKFEKLNFDFYHRTFFGTSTMKPLWRRVLSVVNDLLDEAMGELYVERHFSADAKRKVYGLVDRLISAYRTRIERLDWMEEATKKKALEKLAGFSKKLGYPDEWKDISGLEIKRDSFAANYMRAHSFEVMRRFKRIGRPVDRKEWLMPPQMVNAYYLPTMNEIVFPAAILQPPLFDPDADEAVNFGGIGEVIGHELTHGFDDQGALFNAEGNLENWWTKGDKERFDAKASRLVEQFDTYEPFPGAHVNGKLTLGENIADLGGITIAYDALQLALREKPEEPIDGLSAVQRFFLNYAITEREHLREEIVRLRLKTDPHSLHIYRVNGPLSNMAEFYDAFGCKRGDKMWREPEDRVKIW